MTNYQAFHVTPLGRHFALRKDGQLVRFMLVEDDIRLSRRGLCLEGENLGKCFSFDALNVPIDTEINTDGGILIAEDHTL